MTWRRLRSSKHNEARFDAGATERRSLLGIPSMEGFGVFFTEALRCFEQELNFDCFERKDNAATLGAIKNACIQ
jgi:hypothetical protein